MDYQEISENIDSFLPELKAYVNDMEENCTLPGAVVEMLKNAGCFRMCMPRSWGGPELTSLEQISIIEKLSSVSAAVGWCVMIGCDSGIYSGYIEDYAARALYKNLDTVQAGWIYPGGKAVTTEDGYLVTGRWTFGSGIKHADVISAGCIVFEGGKPKIGDNGKPEWIVVLGTQEDFEIDDNWDTTGLRGTGSHDYHTQNRFFKREHAFSFLKPGYRDGVIWKRNDTFLRKMAGIPLGVCRNSLDFVHEYIKEKKDFNTQTPLRDVASVQRKLGECELKYGACRSYLYDALGRQWAMLEKDQKLTREVRADVWLSRVNVFRSTREIILDLYDLVGGSAIRKGKTPLDNALRDSITWCQHVVGKESGLEAAGKLLLNNEIMDGFPMI